MIVAGLLRQGPSCSNCGSEWSTGAKALDVVNIIVIEFMSLMRAARSQKGKVLCLPSCDAQCPQRVPYNLINSTVAMPYSTTDMQAWKFRL